MKAKALHEEAMDLSFRADQAKSFGKNQEAFRLLEKAAEIESSVARFYFDKPEQEPTRSILVRSAAFLNLKAGLIEQAKEFIFFGLLHLKDELIKEQLNEALELAVSLGRFGKTEAHSEFGYLAGLRQRSQLYVLEPVNPFFGSAVTAINIHDFIGEYIKSLRAYALAEVKRVVNVATDGLKILEKQIEELVNPVVTDASFGSFRFAIANDYISRGESPELFHFKENVISNYHKEIFVNPLDDEDITRIHEVYSDEEINAIFKPLVKVKSPKNPYRIVYYDTIDLSKKTCQRIVNNQRKKLIISNPISNDDIGELESLLIHSKTGPKGKATKSTIKSEVLRSAEFDEKTNLISPKGKSPQMLNEEILLTIEFSSATGFTYSFPDAEIEFTEKTYNEAKQGFFDTFYMRTVELANQKERLVSEENQWQVISALFSQPDKLAGWV